MPQAVIALGSNIAPAKENIDRALAALSELGTVKETRKIINFYEELEGAK